uniref:Putative secreted protein n=1 Tax=Rhipicephalus microplus TaxID=6941 RepID=A0A6M2DB14_RHIMP
MFAVFRGVLALCVFLCSAGAVYYKDELYSSEDVWRRIVKHSPARRTKSVEDDRTSQSSMLAHEKLGCWCTTAVLGFCFL